MLAATVLSLRIYKRKIQGSRELLLSGLFAPHINAAFLIKNV